MKQAIQFNFAGGLDTKSDPFQIPIGKFSSLVNSVFTKSKRLTKRNGFGQLANLPYSSSYATTFNGNLTAVGAQIQAYSPSSNTWTKSGNFYPCNLSTLATVRTTLNQSQVDSAISPSGLLCVAYTDQNPASLSTNQMRYAVLNSTTGQQLLAAQTIADADATYGAPRVFVLSNYFVIVYVANVSAAYQLKFIAIPLTSLSPLASQVISTSITPASTVSFDGIVYSGNGSLYVAWNSAGSGGVEMSSVSPTLTLSSSYIVDAANTASMFSLAVDLPNAAIWVSYWASGNGYSLAVSPSFTTILAPTATISTGTILNLASVAAGNVLSLFYEVQNAYSYDSGVPSNFVNTNTLTSGGTLGSPSTLVRSVGLASKAFISSGVTYFLAAYQSPYQPTYYLINGANGNVVAQLAYENGGGYLTAGLPSVSLSGSTASVAYLIKDFIEALSDANAAGTEVTGGIYSQTGISQATFTLGSAAAITTAEIGTNLNISAGYLAAYDGQQVTEQGFFLWPDSVEKTSAPTTGGALTAQKYYYQVVYSSGDNKGNRFQSAGSIPILVDLSGSGTSTNSVVLQGPNLRLTYKQNVKVDIYRWSTAQQEWFQITSISTPLLNSTTSDSWTYTDTQSDPEIDGNAILYTTGGVVEDIGGPSFVSVFTFDDRLWGITSEDQNLLWFSKQVIEGTPVEMSDLLTQYVAPSISALGPTGPLACGASMDDKLILFKPNAMNYINGIGPDNTGSNSQYSQPIFITSMIGCSNQASIVFQPNGLMFEFASEQGNQIWLLGRDLSTRYIGADVEAFTLGASVTSAVAIPGTTHVRISLDSGLTLMYDYFFDQWGTHSTNIASSTLYNGLHTFINPLGQVFQETPGKYLDGSSPVLMSFVTGWLDLVGLRGYQRIHEYGFLGTYYSPHKLVVDTAFDYNPPSQQSIYSPPNYSPAYGGAPLYGSGVYGGGSNIENFRVFAKQQKCKAFQISVQEQFDPSFGTVAGQGLSLSGIKPVVTLKKGWSPISGRNSVG